MHANHSRFDNASQLCRFCTTINPKLNSMKHPFLVLIPIAVSCLLLQGSVAIARVRRLNHAVFRKQFPMSSVDFSKGIMLRFASFALATFVALSVCVTFVQADEKAAKPTAKPTKAELLKRFSDEFIEIAPGGKSRDGSISFPKSFRMGSDQIDSEKPVHTHHCRRRLTE